MPALRVLSKGSPWLRRLDHLPAPWAWGIGIGFGALTGAALAGLAPPAVGIVGFVALLGLGSALAWSSEPVAEVETISADIDRGMAPLHLDRESFVVWIEPSPGGTMRVRVRSPAGEAAGSFSLPVETARSLIASGMELAPGSAQQIGETLFRALFAGDVGALWARSLSMTTDRGLHLPLRLSMERMPTGPSLDSLPWELLYQPATSNFLALNRLTPVCRSLRVPQPLSPLRSVSVLRILVVSSVPFGFDTLDLLGEQRSIAEIFRDLPRIKITFLDQARFEVLRRVLQEEEFQVLHFIGHGGLDQGTGESKLVFEDVDGAAHMISGLELATAFADCPTLRLVFLNASETARISSAVDHVSLAASLVRSGVPAVIGMQLPISDRAAIEFSRIFYRSLAKGDRLDTAVSEGRQALLASFPESIEWAIPVLFTSSYPFRLISPGSNRVYRNRLTRSR